MKSRSLLFIICLGLIALTGCREVALHHNLEEMECEELLVALHQHGISAKKEKEMRGQDVSWNVTVKEVDLPRARQILLTNNLPRKKELGLSGVYKEKGLIPTPDEQKARYLLALKGEIINSLQKIPGVIDADVVLNVPQENDVMALDPQKKRPTASVVVRTRNEDLIAQTLTEGKLQRFVANTVPNLDPNDVSVFVTRSEIGVPYPQGVAPSPTQLVPSIGSPMVSLPSSDPEVRAIRPSVSGDVVEFAGLKLDRDSVGRFKFYIVGLLLLLLGVSVFLLYNIVRLNRVRLKVQRSGRPSRSVAVGGGQPQSYLPEGGQDTGMEGTFDVSNQRQQ